MSVDGNVVELTGWMSEAEQYALRRWAFGKDVCEIGSYEGLSTVNLSITANSVTAIDPWEDRPDGTYTKAAERGTYAKFCQNVTASGNASKIIAKRGLSQNILPTLDKFDLIFIDGDHQYEAVKEDIKLALPHLKPGGHLLFHDYSSENLGVVKAIEEFRERCWIFPVGQEGSLVLASPVKPPKTKKQIVVSLNMPHRNLDCNLGAAQGFCFASQKISQVVSNYGTSVLPLCFNTLLAEALNQRKTDGVTHFAMLHNDVIPCRNWLDIMLSEMQRLDLDMISAVIPLKNHKGLTSTGIDTIGNPWAVRRLAMAEVFELPETFTCFDIPYREVMAPLVLNSGCTLMKLDEPWATGLHFRQHDRIVYCTSEEKYKAQSVSEDWDMSRQLMTRGCRIAATRKVPIMHERPEFHNKSVWGTQATDEEWQKHREQEERAGASGVS